MKAGQEVSMADDRVSEVTSTHARIRVTSAEVAAAKLRVKLAEASGEDVDPAVRAIAEAKPRDRSR